MKYEAQIAQRCFHSAQNPVKRLLNVSNLVPRVFVPLDQRPENELWKQPFQACAIDADCAVKLDGQNSVISFVIQNALVFRPLVKGNEVSRNEIGMLEALSFDDVTRSPTQILMCSVVEQKRITLKACRFAGILSIEIFFSLK